MTISRIDLEVFNDGKATTPKESLDFKRGFEAGVASCEASDSANLAQASEAIASSLSDMTFGFAEAKILLLERIRPLLCQIAEAVLPQVAKESFSAHLTEALVEQINHSLMLPLEISVSSEAIEYLSSKMSRHADSFIFVGDDTLIEGQAIFRTGEAHFMIDLPALTLALQTALNGLEPPERSMSNG